MPHSNSTTTPQNGPRIWTLLGRRTGDNNQVGALATALGWPVEEKSLDYSLLHHLPNLILGATPNTVGKPARAQLHPPWPDLVIASGRRSVAPALWIKQQSGGRVKLLQLGRPRAPLRLFDLVITTAQYGLPAAENVLSISLPLQALPGADEFSMEIRLTDASQLPRPWTGLLIGGSTWPFIMDAHAGVRLGRDMNRWVARFGGSVLITTSPRTGTEVADSLEKTLDIPYFLHRWTAASDNPYEAILRSADQLVVSSDSVSMLADACRSGKPTGIWKNRLRSDPISRFCLALGGQAQENTRTGRLMRSAALKGLFTPPRHVARLTNAIVASQRASWFAPDDRIPKPPDGFVDTDMEQVLGRVRALFE